MDWVSRFGEPVGADVGVTVAPHAEMTMAAAAMAARTRGTLGRIALPLH